MGKLILSLDGLVLKEYTLTKERTTIGRKPHNDVQIDNLAVSGDHAVIVTILNDSFLEDLGSTNGTLVNGQPIKKHFLQNSDVIELGKYKLKYLTEQTGQPKADFEKTMVLRPGALQAMGQPPSAAPAGAARESSAAPAGAVRESSPAAAQPARSLADAAAPGTAPAAPPKVEPAPAPRVGILQILTGGNAGKELELTKPLTTMGKPGVQVAVITRRPQGYFITHVEGARFPVLNGNTLDAHPHALNDHDVIELAGVKMEFFFKA